MVFSSTVSPTEAELKVFIREKLPVKATPVPLRMAFHDAGSFDPDSHTGGATGSIHFGEELARPENASFLTAVECMKAVGERFPGVSWADVIAVTGAVAVEICGGPVIEVGTGRVAAEAPTPDYRLPTEFTDIAVIKAEFARRGLNARDLVSLSGAHTLGGRVSGPSFTRDDRSFSNSYFVRLVESDADPPLTLLQSDRALLEDPELRIHVERYAADEQAFFEDFRIAYTKMTWLGQERLV